jgi:hypothetical protein
MSVSSTHTLPIRQETSVQTLQLRLRGEYKDLDLMAGHYQKVQRKLYATAAKAKKPFSDFKNEFCEKYKLPSRLFNAMDAALKGMVSSNQEKAKVDLDEVEQRRETNEAKFAKAEAKLAKLIADGVVSSVIKKVANDIRTLRAKIARCVSREGDLKAQSISTYPKICFGSRKLFNAQHWLKDDKLKDHAQWRKQWQARRSDQFQVVGSNDEVTGNKTCRAVVAADGSVTLKLALAGDRYGETLTLPGLRLAHGHDEFVDAIGKANIESRLARSWQAETKRLKDKIDPSLSEDERKAQIKAIVKERAKLRGRQEKLGFAISYRFPKDKTSWRVFITTLRPCRWCRSLSPMVLLALT